MLFLNRIETNGYIVIFPGGEFSFISFLFRWEKFAVKKPVIFPGSGGGGGLGVGGRGRGRGRLLASKNYSSRDI